MRSPGYLNKILVCLQNLYSTWAVSSVISITDYVMAAVMAAAPPLPRPGLRSPGARASPLLVASTCLVRLLIHLEQSRPLQPQLEAAVCPPERGSCITPGTLLTTPCCQGGGSS